MSVFTHPLDVIESLRNENVELCAEADELRAQLATAKAERDNLAAAFTSEGCDTCECSACQWAFHGKTPIQGAAPLDGKSSCPECGTVMVTDGAIELACTVSERRGWEACREAVREAFIPLVGTVQVDEILAVIEPPETASALEAPVAQVLDPVAESALPRVREPEHGNDSPEDAGGNGPAGRFESRASGAAPAQEPVDNRAAVRRKHMHECAIAAQEEHPRCKCECGATKPNQEYMVDAKWGAAPALSDCLDCGMPYGGDDWLDCLLPRWQWLEINPDDGGILCANCMVKRASKLPGAVGFHAVIGISPRAAPPEAKESK